MQNLIVVFFYITFGLKAECCACGEVREEVGLEESMGKRAAQNHGVAGDVIKESVKFTKLQQLPVKYGRSKRAKTCYEPSVEGYVNLV